MSRYLVSVLLLLTTACSALEIHGNIGGFELYGALTSTVAKTVTLTRTTTVTSTRTNSVLITASSEVSMAYNTITRVPVPSVSVPTQPLVSPPGDSRNTIVTFKDPLQRPQNHIGQGTLNSTKYPCCRKNGTVQELGLNPSNSVLSFTSAAIYPTPIASPHNFSHSRNNSTLFVSNSRSIQSAMIPCMMVLATTIGIAMFELL
jgi:hypothetical protein